MLVGFVCEKSILSLFLPAVATDDEDEDEEDGQYNQQPPNGHQCLLFRLICETNKEKKERHAFKVPSQCHTCLCY